MKTSQIQILFLIVSCMFFSCSGDSEILDKQTVIKIPPEKVIPTESFPEFDGVGTPGFPKSLKKYQNDVLYYWARYYYETDGNLGRVDYSHPPGSSKIFSDTYQYNSEGKLIQLEGHDVYTFYWEKDRIVEADKYNAMWHGRSKIFYTYNPDGQLIQRVENNLDFFYSEKTIYSYFADGNLKDIEQYGDYNDSGNWILYYLTHFDGYNGDKNLFLELEIIPGHIAQHQFPAFMNLKHLTGSGYDLSEIYTYKYDSEGRVIEKISDNNKTVYQYY